MGPLITEQQIARYQEDGVMVIKDLIDAHWLAVLAEGVEENLRRPSNRATHYVNDPKRKEHFFFDARVLGEVNAYDRLMMDSPMAQAAAGLMQSSRAILFYISVFVRSAGTRSRTPWHQDQVSWAASGHHACSAWMSLDPVPKDTALEFVKGSHLWTTQYQRPPFFHFQYENDEHTKPPLPDIETHRDDYEILSWSMEPGDCLFFHGMTTHGGSGNLSDNLKRRSVSVQWLGDDARFRLLPGGDDPHISSELLSHGVKPGEPVVCERCPVAFPRS